MSVTKLVHIPPDSLFGYGEPVGKINDGLVTRSMHQFGDFGPASGCDQGEIGSHEFAFVRAVRMKT
jgi:hypothetical protein